jgi:transcriptional regulator with XRE-family HTH domain
MKVKSWLQKKIEEFKDDFDYKLESLILNITEKISKRMSEKKINRSSLAGLLGVSPPAVTKILNGNSNFTLKTLLSISDALDMNLAVNFEPKAHTFLVKDLNNIIWFTSATVSAFTDPAGVSTPVLNANESALMSEELKEVEIAA